MEWLRVSWPWLIPWFLFVPVLAAAIRNALAAEKDRRALQREELEREKLALELERLRQDPAIVADRRAIYERLRAVLSVVMRKASVTREQISELHAIRHDSQFRYPSQIPEELKRLIDAAVAVHSDKEMMERERCRMKETEWKELVDREHGALSELVVYFEAMPGRFREHLLL